MNVKITKSFITKSESWSHENEWRIIAGDNVERIECDLVCGIIIDESNISTNSAFKLIKLCLDKGWYVKVRVLDKDELRFKYINYFETNWYRKDKHKIKRDDYFK